MLEILWQRIIVKCSRPIPAIPYKGQLQFSGTKHAVKLQAREDTATAHVYTLNAFVEKLLKGEKNPLQVP